MPSLWITNRAGGKAVTHGLTPDVGFVTSSDEWLEPSAERHALTIIPLSLIQPADEMNTMESREWMGTIGGS